MGACVHAGTRVLWTMAQPHFQQNLAVGRTSVVVAEKCYVDLLEGVDQVGQTNKTGLFIVFGGVLSAFFITCIYIYFSL